MGLAPGSLPGFNRLSRNSNGQYVRDGFVRFIPHCESHVATRMNYAYGIFEFIEQF